MYKIVLIRHGESEWNKSNQFAGWSDIDLTKKGVIEAHEAATLLKAKKFFFDYTFTSLLLRANKTLNIILEDMNLLWVPVEKNWRLNERHYGDLQGKNRQETVKKYGAEQTHLWRRSYDVRPPEITKGNQTIKFIDVRYEGVPVPKSESLKDVVARAVPYWQKNIVPKIKADKKILISASGNSLRALIKYLDNVSESEIAELNIPTGVPIVYELDKKLKPIKHYYLGDPKKIAAKIAAVKAQTK
jgi:2,3-bisphosphoglycerate-dependent phosphoglycerate mutase